MIYNLTIKDRLTILELLPRQGTIIELMLARSIDEKIRLTPDDIAENQLRQTDAGLVWNSKSDNGRPVEISEAELNLIQKQFDYADKQSKFNIDWIDTYNKLHDNHNPGQR